MSTRKDFSVVALLQPPYRPKRHVNCRFPSHSSFFPFFFFLLSKAHRWSIHPHTQPRFDVRPDTLIDRGIYFFSYLSSHCPPLSHLFSFFHSLPPFNLDIRSPFSRFLLLKKRSPPLRFSPWNDLFIHPLSPIPAALYPRIQEGEAGPLVSPFCFPFLFRAVVQIVARLSPAQWRRRGYQEIAF